MLANLITLMRLPLAAAFAVVVAVSVASAGGEAAAGAGSAPASATTATTGTAWTMPAALPLAWAVVLCAIAALEELTDALDGYVARRTGTVSKLGGILDPLADSLARLTMYFAMALAGWITIAVPLLMAMRDIVVSYTRIIQAMTGGKTSARFSGKLKAVVQGGGVFVVVALAAFGPGFGEAADRLLQGIAAGLIIAATSWSLLDYIHAAAAGLKAMKENQETQA